MVHIPPPMSCWHTKGCQGAACHWPQGEYNVKSTVDGEWRTAPGWPETTNADGTMDNVLVVDWHYHQYKGILANSS